MRLLNTTTIELEEYIGESIPSYAILSHRWEGEEVTFQDLREGRGENMAGYSKITGCCRQAKIDGWGYAWVDSCCIDKSSSAELSEALNSMFKWYQDAEVCYAYLSDVVYRSQLAESQWFTRGWTLQELLAPEFVIFYDRDWKEIGTRSCMWEEIEIITGILHFTTIDRASVAQKMSWASRRTTTRVEDQAYCLMGLFGVNMPTLYGEGKKSFLRLQLEILRISSDETIFAWTKDIHPDRECGLLASSAADFAHSSNILSTMFDLGEMTPYIMTNRGLRVNSYLRETADHFPEWQNRGSDYLMPLLCSMREDDTQLAVLIRSHGRGQYARVASAKLVKLRQERVNVKMKPEVCYIKQRNANSETPRCVFDVKMSEMAQGSFHIAGTISGRVPEYLARNEVQSDETVRLELDTANGTDECALVFTHDITTAPYTFALLFGFHQRRPTIDFVCRETGPVDRFPIWAQKRRPSMDKWSQNLVSGHIVSMQLKRNGHTDDCSKYVVEVGICARAVISSVNLWPNRSHAELITTTLWMTREIVQALSLGRKFVSS
ncbi:hypothetical protein VTL71DRAFT_12335 [Oculimacula yallundae]|uniref:Heterokaryon incompatibility domain-containing protein n=1 Tax=Oculimacula yallundae TaxID=86028 RepID=A0ABR4CMC4_9HELO